MNTQSLAKLSMFGLALLLTACGGGSGSGGGGNGGGAVFATGFIDWTWVGGNDTAAQPSIYAASGVVAASGVPGATEGGMGWTDNTGNLWLFGGSNHTVSQDLNDLWKYDGTNWLWMNGNQGVVNASANYGSLGVPNAIDAAGPGARQYAATWLSHDVVNNIDYLWLFGGYARNSSTGSTELVNDLWRFNMTSRQWTWIGGASTPYQKGHYSTKGTPAPGNVPGARYGAAFWQDGGKFWLYGGLGCDTDANATPCTASLSKHGSLNDLWVYDPNLPVPAWTWVDGADTMNPSPVYGSKGVAAPSPGINTPGGRFQGVSWSDGSGNLWLFGGKGYDATTAEYADLNDLWKYNIAANQWTWESGDNKPGQFGVFGTAGQPAASNVPGARRNGVSCKDNAGNFWLFGGAEDNPANPSGVDILNDVWKYNPSPSSKQWTWMSGSSSPNQFGIYGTQGATAAANVPGARDTAVAWSGNGKCWLLGGTGYDGSGIGSYSTQPLNDFWNFTPK